MRTPATLATLALLLPLLGACGDEQSDPSTAVPREWRTEHLRGETAVDFPTVFVTDGDDALVVMLSDAGVLRSHVSVDGAGFEAGEPLRTGEQWVNLAGAARLDDGSWYVLGSGGSETVDGDEQGVYLPVAFRSDDGRTWERVDVAGFTDDVEFNDLVVVDGRLVAVGGYRTEEDPSSGGFEARVWTSEDGRTFEEAALPGVAKYRSYDDESYVGEVVLVDGTLLASGRNARQASLWRSDDAGRTWSSVDDPVLRAAASISDLALLAGTVVATVSGSDVQAIRSDDGGTTWSENEALPVNEEADGWAPLWSAGGSVFTLTGVDDMSWSEPEVCYADLDQCGRNPGPTLVASTDGESWTSVDIDGLGELDQIAGTADGRVLVMTGGEGSDAVSVHTWPAGAGLPGADRPGVPETVELVTLPEGEEPEVGVRYHAPMYVHCGMDWFWFGDATWKRTDAGPGLETGAGDSAPQDWPVAGETMYGYATLTEDGTVEYSAEDGTVIATYGRRGGAPGCD